MWQVDHTEFDILILGTNGRPARPWLTVIEDYQTAIDTERLTLGPDDPFAIFQLHLLGAVAQLERSLTRERQREGIEIAKTKGVYEGRARKLTLEQVAKVQDLVDAGVPKARVARDLGCSRRVLYDLLAGPRRLRITNVRRRPRRDGWCTPLLTTSARSTDDS